MKAFKIILAIVFAVVIYGNFSMLAKGQFTNSWNYIALIIFFAIEIFLIRSISREPKKEK